GVTLTLEVSKSGFYVHLRGSRGLRRRDDQRLRPLIRNSFEQSRAPYGWLRIRWDLLERGEQLREESGGPALARAGSGSRAEAAFSTLHDQKPSTPSVRRK